jgi:hypothetical protein
MNSLINILTQHSIEMIVISQPRLSTVAAKRMLNVHLDTNHYAMPIHSKDSEVRLVEACITGNDLPAAIANLSFEPTRTIRGIVRVLARTHLNRQGVADIVQDASWKTQSPRVLGIFDIAQSDDDLYKWLDYKSLMSAWLELAYRSTGDNITKEARFQKHDVDALLRLQALSAEEAATMTVSQVTKEKGWTHSNWSKVVLGFYTGLIYLNHRFDFDAQTVWKTIGIPMSSAKVLAISKDAKCHITEYGLALASSFFADLGAPHFVKPDTHVIDCSTAALRRDREISDQEAIEFVQKISTLTDLEPRKIDKLMFFACSANMYLTSLPKPRDINSHKQRLLQKLRSANFNF